MKKSNGLAIVLALGLLPSALYGCARGTEFSVAQQHDAQDTGAYPRFHKPVAATAQFSEDDRQRLTTQLDGNARNLKNAPSAATVRASEKAVSKEDARREAEDVLKQIEQSHPVEETETQAQ